VDTFLGSFTGEGGLASLGYAQLVQVLPISLFGVAVTAVALPELSRDAVGETPHDQLRARIATGFRRIAFFVLPSAFAFAAFGPQIVGALFQTGRFDADDTVLVGGVLVAAALIAVLLGTGMSHLAAGWRPIPRGIAVLGMFGVAYGALTLAFRHPDATRAWQSLTGSPAN